MKLITPEEKLRIYYYQTIDLWRRLCEEHNELYKITCEEYHNLLSGNIQEVEECTKRKIQRMELISDLDKIRIEIINSINQDLDEENIIKNARQLILLLVHAEEKEGPPVLENANRLLIEIIEGIQKQNKKNQLFINRALHSLKDIRNVMLGQKKYENYNATGSSSGSVK